MAGSSVPTRPSRSSGSSGSRPAGGWCALAATLVLATGCGAGDGTGSAERTAPAPVSPAPPAPEAETVQEDVDAAVEVVNGYWAELFTGSYRPPRVLGASDGAARDVPACGGQALVDDNAVYCGVNDYVAWDVDLMSAGHRLGDNWVYLVIAHEWAHAVQRRLDRQLVSLAAELQADCLAGAVLFGAAEDGTLQFEEVTPTS